MWLSIIALTLLPLFLGIAKPSIRPARIYVGLALLVVVGLVPVHGYLNAKHDPKGVYKQGHSLVLVTPNRFETVSGPYLWRFFRWGVLQGDGASTPFYYWLSRNTNIHYDLARAIDVTNPTPFLIFVWLLILAALSPRERSMHKMAMLILGGGLLVAAVVAVIAAQPMYEAAKQVHSLESLDRYDQMQMTGDILKYGGFGAGAIGFILLLLGILKKTSGEAVRSI